MAAVRKSSGDGPLEAEELPRHVFDSPPPATDRLPVMPLPAQDVLTGSVATIAATDTLRSMANKVAKEPEGTELAEPGEPGGYQLQVSSFQEQGDADAFVLALRRRGHRAYVQPAHVQGRGLWHRVRIGPFRYKRSAEIYRQDFEAKERMVTFIVDPPKAKIHVALAEEDSD
jgi:cell division septation protein DedD